LFSAAAGYYIDKVDKVRRDSDLTARPNQGNRAGCGRLGRMMAIGNGFIIKIKKERDMI